jgi:dipeptidyl aminopeptidase/acylaminoacyl peptidase
MQGKIEMLRRITLWSVAGIVLLSLASLGAIGWVGSERALHPEYHRYEWSLATFPDLDPEHIQVRSFDGVLLDGRFFRGAHSSLVILASGYGDTQDQMLSIAEFLHRAGFSVLTYNPRARLPSGGRYVTVGALEQKDVLSVVNYAAGRSDVDANRIGILGISMGGASAIMAAAKDKRIRAVVDDSGFSDGPRVIATAFEHFVHLPAFPFAPITVAIADWRAGVDITRVRPMDVIAEISPRPLLIIHEQGDSVVLADNSLRNFAAAGQPKQLWLVPGSGHGDAQIVVKSQYQSRVTSFFEEALR